MASLSDLRWLKYDTRYYKKNIVDDLMLSVSGTLSYDLTSTSGILQTQLDNVSVTTKNTFGFKVNSSDGYTSIIVPCDCVITNYNSSGPFMGNLDFSIRKGSNLNNVPFTSTEDITPILGSVWVVNDSSSTMIPKSSLTGSRSATGTATLDDNDVTSEGIQFNDFEYRWSGVKKLHKVIATFSINTGIFSTIVDFDFYYIPVGETQPSNYVKFATYSLSSNTGTYSHINVEEKLGDYDWVEADGFYLIHSAGVFEEGWAALEEVEAYEYTDDDLYHINRYSVTSWQDTDISEGDALVLTINTVSGTFDYMDLNLEVEC